MTNIPQHTVHFQLGALEQGLETIFSSLLPELLPLLWRKESLGWSNIAIAGYIFGKVD